MIQDVAFVLNALTPTVAERTIYCILCAHPCKNGDVHDTLLEVYFVGLRSKLYLVALQVVLCVFVMLSLFSLPLLIITEFCTFKQWPLAVLSWCI